MGTYIRRLMQRWRMWKFEGFYYKNGVLKTSPYSLFRLVWLIDDALLDDYRPSKGVLISFVTGFTDSTHLLEWLYKFNNSMNLGIPVPSELGLILLSQRTVTLESFLVNSVGGTISASALHIELIYQLNELLLIFGSMPECNKKEHYRRRINILYPSVTPVIEGLFKAALIK